MAAECHAVSYTERTTFAFENIFNDFQTVFSVILYGLKFKLITFMV